MSNQLIDTKPKLPVKAKGKSEDIIWGSRLFINAQIILQLINIISKYLNGEEDLQNIFNFPNTLNKQHKVMLYKELRQEIDEICFLEKEMKEGTIKPEDKSIIDFVLNSTISTFTTNIPRRNK